ncbi:MAG TPA: hypothetical protein VFE61_10225 [Candidatus Sulfotelmatobacter sp.]|nr:hypothetical protein [Candidatus Sulfotelmatobacter sp.]
MSESLLSALLAAAVGLSCGGGGSSSVTTPDFSISVAPASVSADVGTTTSPVTISVNPQPGCTGSVSVMLQGVPQGDAASPSSSFSLAAGGSQAITFSVPPSATVGTSSITALATSGSHSHKAQITLIANAIVRTYQIGSVLYLESGSTTDTARIGLQTSWGGSIVEVSLNGTNFVNEHDTGREVQPSYRDGSNQNYNPTLGDLFDQGTPTISYIVEADSLFIQAQPLQWDLTSYGGG